jgi:hypothetical protein
MPRRKFMLGCVDRLLQESKSPGGTKMVRYKVHQVDNRDANQMYDYLEARIEAMKRRIEELESENQSMRHWIQYQSDVAVQVEYVEALASA